MDKMARCELTGKLPRPLGDMPGLVINNQFLIFGGGSGEETTDAILMVDPQTGYCSQIGEMPYRSRGHQVISINNEIYLLGGFSEGTKDDVWHLDIQKGTSERIKPMPTSKAWFGITGHKGLIVIVGGFSIPEGYLGNIEIYNPQTDSWKVEERALPQELFPNGRIGGNVLVSDEYELVLMGGADQFDNQSGRSNAFDLTCRYNPITHMWKKLTQTISPREGMGATSHNGTVFLVGGMAENQEEPSRLVETVSLASARVSEVANMVYGRLSPAVGMVENRLIIAGGVLKPLFNMADTLECLEIL